jgi:hypothetical protein
MGTLSDYAKAILVGGIPAAVDLGSKAGNLQGDKRTEQVAPSGTLQDRDTNAPVKSASVVDFITGKEIAIGAAGLLVVGVVLYLAIKTVKKI